MPPGKGAAAELAKVAWADGALAALRHDAAALSIARSTIRAANATSSVALDRTLAALGRLGSSSPSRAAADSLSAIDLSATEGEVFESDWVAASINHLAASNALLLVGDTARALKELTWTDARPAGGGGLIVMLCAGHAYFLRARVEEAQGRNDLAREHYAQFLRRYDSPIPSQRHLVDEARRSLARLSAARN